MEDVTGLKCYTEDMDLSFMTSGSGAFLSRRSGSVRNRGALGSENAGMSNHKWGENPHGRKSKDSWATVIAPGLVGPKPRRIA